MQTTKTSVHGAINMLGLAKRTRARILQASTSEVYGDPEGAPADRVVLGAGQPDRAALLLPDEHSMLDLAQTIVRLCNSSSRVVQVALPSDDPRHRRPDIARARALLDWSPTTPLEQGLRRTIEYFDALLTARGRRAVAQGSA